MCDAQSIDSTQSSVKRVREYTRLGKDSYSVRSSYTNERKVDDSNSYTQLNMVKNENMIF